MLRPIRRTFSSAAVLALAAGSVLVAVPAQADAVPEFAVTSPSPGEVIRGGSFTLAGSIPEVGDWEYLYVGANWTNSGGPIFEQGGPGLSFTSPHSIWTTIDTCGWPDGPVDLVFQAQAATGVVVAENSFTVSIADNPPCVVLDSPVPGSTQIYGGVHITGSILGGSTATYSIDWAPEQAVPLNPDGTFDFWDAAGDGTHTLRVWRTEGGYAESEFIADATAPVVTITSPNQLAHFEPGEQFDLHATITDAAPSRWELFLDGNLLDSGNDIAANGTIVVPIDTDGWSEQQHDLHLVAWDVAGIQGDVHRSVSVGGPQVTITAAPAPGATISNGRVRIAGSVYDADLSWWEVALVVFPGYDEQYIGGTHSDSFSYTFDTSTWADGPYTLVVDAMNGSAGYNRQEFPIIVDNPNPGSNISVEVDGSTAHVTGEIGLVEWPSYSIDGGTPELVGLAWAGDSATTFDFFVGDLAEGSHTVKVFPGSSPVYEAVSSTFVVDLVPGITDVVWPNWVRGGDTISVSATVTDSSMVSAALVWEGGTPSYPTPVTGGTLSPTINTTGIEEGLHVLEFWFSDAHGNESHVSNTIYVDTEAPGVSHDAPSGTHLTATSELTGYQFDDSGHGDVGSGVDGVDLTVNGYDGSVCLTQVGPVIHATLNDVMSWTAMLPGGIAPGIYCVTATATDGVGHSSSSTGYYPIDLAAPAAPTPLSPSGFVNDAIELDWTGDAGPGLTYDWQLDGLDGYLDGGSTSGSHVELSSPLPPGEYSFRVRAVDSLVNAGEWSEYLAFTVDSTDPTVTIDVDPAGAIFSGTYGDGESGVAGISLTVQSSLGLLGCGTAVGQPVAASFAEGAWTATLAGIDSGGYCVTATATDRAGNSASYLDHIYIDSKAPSVPVPLSPSGLVGPVSEFDWTDATDASDDVHYDWELLSPSTAAAEACPAPPAPCPSAVPTTGTTSVSHLTRITPLTTEGRYKFRVRAVDALGNASAWSAYLEFTIDSTRPYVYFDLAADADVNAMTPLLGGYGDGKGGGSGVDKLELTLQTWDGDAEECTSLVGDPILASLDNGTWSADLPAIGFGHYCIVAAATDGVGNIGTDVGRFWIDTIAPDAPEPIAASGPVGPGSVLDWYNVFDDSELPVEYEYEVYNPSGLVGAPGHTTDSKATADPFLPSGGYHFRVRAIDAFGNPSEWSVDQSFLVDATAPTLSLDLPVAGGSSASADVTFRWTSPDRDIELFALQVSPTAAVDDYGQLTAGHTWVTSDYSQLVTGLANGRYYWHVIALDRAGNESGWSELRILDVATPPAPPKSSGLGATAGDGDESDEPEPTETTEPTPEPTATEEPVEKTDDEPGDGADDSAGGTDPAAAGTGDSGFPIVWIIVGVVIVALVGGGFFFIRFLFRRA